MKNLFRKIDRFCTDIGEKNISAHAASTAFFFFISLVPMLLLLCAMLPMTNASRSSLENMLLQVTPGVISGFTRGLLQETYRQSVNILPLAGIVLFWTAGKGILALTRGLNAVYEVEENRNYFVVRFIATLHTFLFLVAIILSLVLTTLGYRLVYLLCAYMPGLKSVLELIVTLRFLITWAILTLLFAGIYTFVPGENQKFKVQLPGACLASACWNLFSFGFSLYMQFSKAYTIYGSLSLIVIVMIWLYFCMYFIFVGANLNRFLTWE